MQPEEEGDLGSHQRKAQEGRSAPDPPELRAGAKHKRASQRRLGRVVEGGEDNRGSEPPSGRLRASRMEPGEDPPQGERGGFRVITSGVQQKGQL